MDKIVEEVEKAKKEQDETYFNVVEQIKAIEGYEKSAETEKKDSLPKMKGLAHDGLSLLHSLQFKIDLLVPQLPKHEKVQYAKSLLEAWKNQSQRENFFSVVEESPQFEDGTYIMLFYSLFDITTKAGMTSVAESITQSLLRTRQLMVREVERSTSTLMTFEESTGVLKKVESEYNGHCLLLMRTRNPLSTMQRQDVIDRIILAVGFFLFSCADLYVVSKRISL